MRNSQKTHCPSGHEYTPENTYYVTKPNGSKPRSCKACRAIRDKVRYGKKERRENNDDLGKNFYSWQSWGVF